MRRVMALLLAVAAGAGAQQTFEAASVRRNATADARVATRILPGGRYTATNVTARMLLAQALGVRELQVLNAPGWADAERWDINAVAEGLPEHATQEMLRPLLLGLLRERFQLQYHAETRELPVYLLVPAKGGAKLQASEMQGEQARGTMRVGRGTVTAQAIPLSWLARQLAQVLGRDVIDKTGLASNFDFELAWTPEPGQGGGSSLGGPQTTGPMPAADLSGPSLFGALQEQLGLRLEASRGPVQVYVVDRIARPGEN